MSYLIQNFKYTSSSLRYNLKLRALLLLRNTNILFSLVKLPWQFTKLLYLDRTLSSYRKVVGFYLFMKFTKILLPSIKLFKYTPIGINYPKSAHFTALTLLLSAVSVASKSVTKLQHHTTSTSNLNVNYILSSQIYITTLAYKPVKTALFKLMFMSLSCWFNWPRRYTLPAQSFSLSAQWHLLKFLNVYFFKIYNL